MSSVLGELVSIHSGLLLGLGLFTPLQVAPLETPVDADGQVVRNTSGEADNLLDTNISESGSDDIRWETEESLSDLVNTRVLIVESGDECEGFTAEVELEMDRSFGEDGSLTLGQRVSDKASTVLLDESDVHLAVDEEQEFGRSGVGVWGVHSARCHLTDSQGHAVRKEGGEVGDVGDGEVSAGIPGGSNPSIVIEQPVSVVLEDVETGNLSGSLLQIRHKLGSFGSIGDLGDSLESGTKNERNSSGELHDA